MIMSSALAPAAATPAAMHRHPAWFGSVMGTAALALAFAAEAATWDVAWLTWLAEAALVLASVLALVLLPRYAARLGDRAALARELADPAHGAMLATLPAGLLVLAAAWGRIGPSLVPTGAALWVDGVLLAVGIIVALALGIAWASALLRATPGLEGVNGGWVIPPVMNLIVPLGLSPLIAANAAAAPLLVLVGFAFYGVGAILFVAMITLLIARLALRDPLPPAMAPSLWIPLAPAGILGLALLRLQQSAAEAGVPGFTDATAGIVVSAMGLGFGLWWAAFAMLELRRIRRAGGPPVHPGWWGFVFPIGAMTLSMAAVGSSTGIWIVQVLGLAGTVLLTAVWLLVFARTAGMVRRPRA
jgi:C4-dicarboxylate transporter/malic acid transport protein